MASTTEWSLAMRSRAGHDAIDGDVVAVIEAGLLDWTGSPRAAGRLCIPALGKRMGPQRQMLYILFIVLALGGVLYVIGVI